MAAKKQQSPPKNKPHKSNTRVNEARASGVPAKSGRLAGKVAVITGGSRGIGLAIARVLASEGCSIIISGRDRKTLTEAASGIQSRFPAHPSKGKQNARVVPEICDVRDPTSVERLFATVEREFGRLDVLVNNAGVAQPVVSIEHISVELWREVIDTNMTGLFLCTRAALPLMQRGGTIINNLSAAAKHIFPNFSAYNSSKHGALGFTLSLREELKERGVRVTALMPGAIDTEIWKQFWPEAPRERMMRAETIAELVLTVLLLPPSSNLTEILVDPIGGAL